MKQASDTKLTPKSLSCLNHLKHGSTSKTLFLKDENPEEFFALLENFFLQHQPNFDHDAALVTRAAHDFWIMLRRERTVDAYEKALHTRNPDPTYWVQPDQRGNLRRVRRERRPRRSSRHRGKACR
jgi:hypothetical protein